MANNAKVMSSVKDFLLKMKALDEAIPEELAKDALEMTENIKDALCDEDPNPLQITEDEDPKPEENNMEGKVEDAMVKVLKKYGLIKDSSMSALDELEEGCKAEVEDEDGEEEVTVDPDKMNDEAIMRTVKPVIAGIKDSKTRKQVSDAFAKALKMSVGTNEQYGQMMAMARMSAKDSMAKKKQPTQDADYDFGMDLAKRFNPHYKKEG